MNALSVIIVIIVAYGLFVHFNLETADCAIKGVDAVQALR